MDDNSPSELKKVLKDSYVVWCKGDTKRKYVYVISSSGTSTTSDIDDAIKVSDLAAAEAIKKIAEDHSSSTEYHISHVQVIVEDIIPGVSTF